MPPTDQSEPDIETDDGSIAAPRTAPDRATREALRAERARDAALAMQEYQAEKLAVLANTERLRALRLTKEPTPNPPKKAKAPARKDR